MLELNHPDIFAGTTLYFDALGTGLPWTLFPTIIPNAEDVLRSHFYALNEPNARLYLFRLSSAIMATRYAEGVKEILGYNKRFPDTTWNWCGPRLPSLLPVPTVKSPPDVVFQALISLSSPILLRVMNDVFVGRPATHWNQVQTRLRDFRCGSANYPPEAVSRNAGLLVEAHAAALLAEAFAEDVPESISGDQPCQRCDDEGRLCVFISGDLACRYCVNRERYCTRAQEAQFRTVSAVLGFSLNAAKQLLGTRCPCTEREKEERKEEMEAILKLNDPFVHGNLVRVLSKAFKGHYGLFLRLGDDLSDSDD